MPYTPDTLPPRLEKLRTQLISNIPVAETSAAALGALSLPEIVLAYVNWAARFIKPRRRSVRYAQGFWKGEAALQRGGDVLSLEAAIKNGANLTPYLSNRIFVEGYCANVDGIPTKGISWGDKDFALNAYGVHHLHFLPAINGRRGAEPGHHGHLLYAEFSKHVAFLVMVGNHKSFDDGTLHEAIINARAAAGRFELVGLRGPQESDGATEDIRLARRGLTTIGFKDGRAFVGASVSSAGTSPWHTAHASRILRTLSSIEPKLDEDDYWRSLFSNAGRACPATANLEWHIEYTELSVIEHNSRTKFILVDGLN